MLNDIVAMHDWEDSVEIFSLAIYEASRDVKFLKKKLFLVV